MSSVLLNGTPHLKLCYQRPVHPVHWAHLLVVVVLHTTDQPHALHLPDTPNREPSVATRFRKPSTGMPQFFCFFRFPPPHCEVAFLPLTFTQRVRRDSSLPLPIFLRGLDPFLPFTQVIWDLVSDILPRWTSFFSLPTAWFSFSSPRPTCPQSSPKRLLFFAAFWKPLLLGSDCLALSLFPSFSDRQLQAPFLNFSL